MMEILENVIRILSIELFSVGGQVVTPFRLVATLLVFMMTWCGAVWVGNICKRRFLSSLEESSRYALIRLVQYGIWIVGILLGLDRRSDSPQRFTQPH